MVIRLHKKARTTPEIRREIQASDLPATVLAEKYGVHRHTIRKWRKRDTVEDASHRPHRIHATLSPEQEAIVVCLRETLLLPLDDLLAVVRQFIHPDISRSALDRLLRRYGVSNLKALIAAKEGEHSQSKTQKGFNDYEPRFVHVDIKYLPRMPDETCGRYLFVAIDRACQAHDIEHRLIPPKRPQTNGMVERFNGRIAEIVKTTRFHSGKELEQTLLQYAKVYNHQIPQKALGHISPVQALKNWQAKRPELFKIRVYNLTGLDTYPLQPKGGRD